MQVDFLIIGQGLSGTFLSYYLLQSGARIAVIDNEASNSASRVAGGVINPVTGRRVVNTWRIDDLLPFASNAYSNIGTLLKIPVYKTGAVYDFHASLQMKQAFESRLGEESKYICNEEPAESHLFHYQYGVGKIAPSLIVDLPALLPAWKNYLKQNNYIINDYFNWDLCVVQNNSVTYKDISAGKIIFCDGIASASHPYFKHLPFALNKGQAIVADIPGLPVNNVYKQGITLVPWQRNKVWIGSTYEWNYENVLPTPDFRQTVEIQLNRWLKLPYKIMDHIAAVRPASLERRPFVGMHPKYTEVGILNGMGTKGCSLAPFFAYQLTQKLLYNTPIWPEADIARFTKTLHR